MVLRQGISMVRGRFEHARAKYSSMWEAHSLRDIVLSKQGFSMVRSRSGGDGGDGTSTSEVFEVEDFFIA